MRNSIIVLIAIIALSACTKGLHEEIVPVDLNLNNIGVIAVMDAKIEKDSSAWVQISYSNDIDNPYTSEPIFETNATITISSSEGGNEQLTYTGKKGIYRGTAITGNIGETYNLNIEIAGQEYSASATMLPTANFNTIELNPITTIDKNGNPFTTYDEVWYINNDINARNLYMFEWWTNGVHLTEKDWAIDDDRIPNGSNGIRVFNPTIDPGPNQRTEFKMAEIGFNTYNYFNMYEKIVRGIVSVSSQTPYNPVSSFGPRTIGNFRAVSFTNYVALTPPALYANNFDNILYWESNQLFIKYNLFWSNSPNITETNSTKIEDVAFTTFIDNEVGYNAFTTNDWPTGSTYYFCIQAEDVQGNKSILSSEVSTAL